MLSSCFSLRERRQALYPVEKPPHAVAGEVAGRLDVSGVRADTREGPREAGLGRRVGDPPVEPQPPVRDRRRQLLEPPRHPAHGRQRSGVDVPEL